MRIVCASISAWRDSMGLWLVVSKNIYLRTSEISAVLAAIAFRTSAHHGLIRRTFQPVLAIYTPVSLSSKSQVISPSPYLWWHSWYGARYSYFTTITPTCLCNYRVYRTLWCRGDTSVIPWPGYGLNNWDSSPPCISFRTLCASTLARVLNIGVVSPGAQRLQHEAGYSPSTKRRMWKWRGALPPLLHTFSWSTGRGDCDTMIGHVQSYSFCAPLPPAWYILPSALFSLLRMFFPVSALLRKFAQTVTLLVCIWEVPSSSSCYPDSGLRGFSVHAGWCLDTTLKYP